MVIKNKQDLITDINEDQKDLMKALSTPGDMTAIMTARAINNLALAIIFSKEEN